MLKMDDVLRRYPIRTYSFTCEIISASAYARRLLRVKPPSRRQLHKAAVLRGLRCRSNQRTRRGPSMRERGIIKC